MCVAIGSYIKTQVRDLHSNKWQSILQVYHQTCTNEVDGSPTRYLQIERLDDVKGIRHKQVYVHRIGLIYGYYAMYFYYLRLFFIDIFLLDKFRNVLLNLSLSVMRCMSGDIVYEYQTFVV